MIKFSDTPWVIVTIVAEHINVLLKVNIRPMHSTRPKVFNLPSKLWTTYLPNKICNTNIQLPDLQILSHSVSHENHQSLHFCLSALVSLSKSKNAKQVQKLLKPMNLLFRFWFIIQVFIQRVVLTGMKSLLRIRNQTNPQTTCINLKSVKTQSIKFMMTHIWYLFDPFDTYIKGYSNPMFTSKLNLICVWKDPPQLGETCPLFLAWGGGGTDLSSLALWNLTQPGATHADQLDSTLMYKSRFSI